MNIGERIKYLRETKKITQEELGKLVGVNKATINRYETGTIDIKRTIAIKLAKVFNCSPAYIMGWDDEPTKENTLPVPKDKEIKIDEVEMLANYRRLNALGKEKAQEYMTDLTENEKYTALDTELKSKLNA